VLTFEWLDLSYGRDLYEYANRAVGFTRRKSGGRDSVVREDPGEQSEKGQTVSIAEIFSRVGEDLGELRFETRNLLQAALDAEVFHASGEIEPELVEPGYTQDLDEVPERVFLEEAAYSFGPGDASVSLSMGKLGEWNKTVVQGGKRERQTRASIGTQLAEEDEEGEEEEPEGDVSITITGTNSPIEEGERLSVEFDATNNLSEEQEAEITLEILGPGESGVVETLNITFTGDETESLEAGWQTETGDAGDYTATVSSGTDSDSRQVTVEQPQPEGDASVTITGTNSPVIEGDDVVVTFDATNNLSQTQTVQFTLDVDIDTQVQDTITKEFTDGETKTGLELRWSTEDGDAGDYTAEVSSGTDSDTASVTVEEEDVPPGGDVDITITGTNSPVEEGDPLTVTYDATNNLSQQQDADINLNIDIDQQVQDTDNLSFTGGETKTGLTLEWQTENGDSGTHTAEVASGTDSDTTQVEVEEPDLPPEGDVSITITGTNSPVEEGTPLTVTYDATNNLSQQQEAEINLDVDIDTQVQDTDNLTFTGGETKTGLTLEWQTETGDAGDYTAEVASDTDSDSRQVTVEQPQPEGDASVTITGTNSPVIEGDDMVVTFDATNNLSQTQTVQFTLDVDVDTQVQDTVTLDFTDGETKTGLELRWTTQAGDAGDYTATVESGTASDTAQVTVKEPDTTPTGDVDISNLSTNSPVEEGDPLVATFDATNNLSQQQQAEITLDVDIDTNTQATTGTLTFADSETLQDLTLVWQTETGDSGTYTAEVASDTDSATASVTVEKPQSEGDASVTITGTNSPVIEGDDVVVTFDATNNLSQTQTVQFTLDVDIDTQVQDTITKQFTDGETKTGLELRWSTEDGDVGDYTATVESGTDSDTASVTVEPQAPSSVSVEILGTNSPVEEGDDLEVTAEITNQTGQDQTMLTTLELPQGNQPDWSNLAIRDGQAQTVTLIWSTEEGDSGIFTAEVTSGISSSTDSDTTQVEVEEVGPGPSGDVGITITGTNSPVAEKDQLNVVFDATNNRQEDQEATIIFSTIDSAGVERDRDNIDLSFTPGETKTNETLVWQTQSGDAGDYTAKVRSQTDSDTTPVEVVEDSEPGGDVDITITGTNSPVEEGKDLNVNFNAKNNLNSDTTAILTLDIPASPPEERDFRVEEFTAGEDKDLTLTWSTETGDAGNYTAKVSSGTDSDTTEVQVVEDKADGDFSVTITGTNSPVETGDRLTVDAEITNNLSQQQEGKISLSIEDGGPGQTDTVDVDLGGGGSTTETLTWQTQSGDEGFYDAVVRSGQDKDTARVRVFKQAPEGDIQVSITSTNSPVVETNWLFVDVEAEKTNPTNDILTGFITLSITDSSGNTQQPDTRTIALEDGEVESFVMRWKTQTGDAGDYTARVDSATDFDTASVTVVEPEQEFDYSLSSTCSATETPVKPGGGSAVTIETDVVQNKGPEIERRVQFFLIRDDGTEVFKAFEVLSGSGTVSYRFPVLPGFDESEVELCARLTDPQNTTYESCCSVSTLLPFSFSIPDHELSVGTGNREDAESWNWHDLGAPNPITQAFAVEFDYEYKYDNSNSFIDSIDKYGIFKPGSANTPSQELLSILKFVQSGDSSDGDFKSGSARLEVDSDGSLRSFTASGPMFASENTNPNYWGQPIDTDRQIPNGFSSFADPGSEIKITNMRVFSL